MDTEHVRDLLDTLRSAAPPRRRIGAEWRDGALTLVEVLELGAGPSLSAAVNVPAGGDDPSETLASALESSGIRPAPVRLAVGGERVTVKPLELPPVSRADLLSMLEAESERYFLLPSGRRCHGVFGDDVEGSSTDAAGATSRRTWAVAAPAAPLKALVEAFEARGFHVESATASVGVYEAAARFLAESHAVVPTGLADGASDRDVVLVRAVGDRVERVRRRGGRLLDVSVDSDRHGSDTDRAPARPHRSVEEADERQPVEIRLADGADAFASRRLVRAQPGTLAGALGAALTEPEAAGAGLPDLLPGPVRERLARWRRRAGAALSMTAVALCLAGAVLLPRRDAMRQARLTAELARMRQQVVPVMRQRGTIETAGRRVEAFREEKAATVSPRRLLDLVAEELPEEAWLSGLAYAAPDRLVLRGYAPSATDVLAALSRGPALANVRLRQATRSVRVDGTSLESFALEAELRRETERTGTAAGTASPDRPGDEP